MVPDSWRRYRIRDLLTDDTPGYWGTAPSESGSIAVLRSTNLRENEKLNYDNVVCRTYPEKKVVQKKLEPGDILLERSGGGPNKPVGRIAYFQNEGRFGFTNFMQRLRPDHNLVYGKFLACVLSYLHASGVTSLMQQATTGIRNLNYKEYLSHQLSIPPIPEQRKIAAILSSVDDATEKTQAVIDQVQGVRRGLMQELLTRGLPGRHRQFKQTVIGDLPETWAVRTVNSVTAPSRHSCIGGPFGSDLTRNDYVDFAGVPVIRGSNLSAPSARLNEVEFVFVSDAKANALQRNMAFPGDLIFTQRGTLGQVCRIPIQSKFRRYVLSQSQIE